jgi:hypothetical protein
MKRGWMISKEFELLHNGKQKGIYRDDGTLYAACVAGRLYFSGHSFDLLPKQIKTNA